MIAISVLLLSALGGQCPAYADPARGVRLGPPGVADRLEQYGDAAMRRWQPYMDRAGVSFPPARLIFLGLKSERRLEIYGSNAAGEPFRFIRSLPILAASGRSGPKLREGDGQVPEGFYRIEALNPNSRFHLSLRVSYPSEFDRRRARLDRRDRLGGDIMIHGSQVSIGCLAMGDEAAEDLFVLAARSGLDAIKVILSPVDFRVRSIADDEGRPAWIDALYAELRKALANLPSGDRDRTS